MDNSKRPIQSRAFILQALDGGLRILNSVDGSYFSVNEATAMVWNLCNGKLRISIIKDLIKEAYPNSRNEIDRDVDEILYALESYGAIRMSTAQATEPHRGYKVAVLMSIFYEDLGSEMAEYVNRIPFGCDIYLSTKHPNSLFKRMLLPDHNIIECDYPDYGMDIGPFMSQVDKIRQSGEKYDYYLKIHSKKLKKWRRRMFEACLPMRNYDKIFQYIDDYNMLGSEHYKHSFSSSHQNKELILDQISKYLDIDPDDVYDRVKDFDPENEKLDTEFYFQYHQDLHTFALAKRNQNIDIKPLLRKHWLNRGIKEDGRIPNENLITRKAKKNYSFYAGSVFWFNQKYFDYLIKNTDSSDLLKEKLSMDAGKLTNERATYTHHLEYWFGLLASNMNKPVGLKGIRSITFLIPVPPSHTVSGGFRTVFRNIAFLFRQNYIVNIEICSSKNNDIDILRGYIDAYHEIDHIDDINIYFDTKSAVADIYVATGWQTFDKSNKYKNNNQIVCYFCQDLEYEFPAVAKHEALKKRTLRFYTEPIPTFAISRFLGNVLNDGRKIEATGLNVDTSIFFDNNQNRSGVCLFYRPYKNRLPEVIKEVAQKIAEKYPDKPIYLFGNRKNIISALGNIVNCGELNLKELAELYIKCELGICFSTTNPSRAGFEMIACGLPCIEADNRFTKFDMDTDAFIKLKPEADIIVEEIDSIFTDNSKLKYLQKECKEFSGKNFYPLKEEAAFLEFLEEEVLEKKAFPTLNLLTNIPEFILRRSYSKDLSLKDVGGNTGNILFWESTARLLWQQGYTLHNLKEQRRVKYEGCVLVYANSIDNIQNNANELNARMDLLPNPDIPVLVLSIGAQNSSFDYFQLGPQTMNALSKLERRSTKIFLRGDYTLNLLEHNNIPNISKYVSLGCPSMLLQDIDWEKHASKWSSLTEESNIAIAIPDFSQSSFYMKQLIPYSKRPNVYTIVQTMPGVIDFAIHKGKKSKMNWVKHLGINDTEFDAIVSNQKNFKSFTDIKEYMTFLEDIDFCIGTRIHATIASILSGTPSLCLAFDSRTLELCQKMHIPHVDCTSPVDIGEIFEFIKNNYNIIPDKIQGHVDFMRETYCKEIESSFKPSLAMEMNQIQAI